MSWEGKASAAGVSSFDESQSKGWSAGCAAQGKGPMEPEIALEVDDADALTELLFAVRRAANRLPGASPWKAACREIGESIASDLGSHRLRLELLPPRERTTASQR